MTAEILRVEAAPSLPYFYPVEMEGFKGFMSFKGFKRFYVEMENIGIG